MSESHQIALVIDGVPDAGGGQRVALDTLKALSELNWRVYALVGRDSFLSHQIHTDPLLRSVKVHLMTSPARKKGLLSRIVRNFRFGIHLWQHRKLMSEATICIVNDPDFFFPACILARCTGKYNLIIYAHLVYTNLKKKFFKTIVQSQSVNSVWTASNFLNSHLLDCTRGKPVYVIEPACRFQIVSTQIESQHKNVASIGMLHPNKGHDLLCQAAKKHPDLQFHIIGSPSNQAQIYASELQRSSPKNVIFRSYVNDLPNYFNEHCIGIVVSASKHNQEAFGLTALEAVALGLEAIVRRTGGLSEIADKLGLSSGVSDEDLMHLLDVAIAHPSDQNQKISQQAALRLQYSFEAFKSRISRALEASKLCRI